MKETRFRLTPLIEVWSGFHIYKSSGIQLIKTEFGYEELKILERTRKHANLVKSNNESIGKSE